jgi:hypothetical protein
MLEEPPLIVKTLGIVYLRCSPLPRANRAARRTNTYTPVCAAFVTA